MGFSSSSLFSGSFSSGSGFGVSGLFSVDDEGVGLEVSSGLELGLDKRMYADMPTPAITMSIAMIVDRVPDVFWWFLFIFIEVSSFW